VAEKPGAWVTLWPFTAVGTTTGMAEANPQAVIIKGKIKPSQCFIHASNQLYAYLK
jgi:hypothetical protein